MAIAEPKHEVPAAVAPTADEGHPTLQRLEDQITWYDRKSAQCQQRFKVLKAQELAAAASIPVVAAFDVPVYVAGILGAVVVVTEGVLHVNQYHQNWITYRSTAESLKHEKYLFLARADVYSGSKRPLRLLAERIEGLISQEHARWISSRRQRVEAEDEDEEEPPSAR